MTRVRSSNERRRWASVAASVAGAAIIAVGSTARADEPSPKGKGIVGGALLGGEVVMSVEAAFGVQSTWAYIIGGVAGAGAGGVGGYFVERNATDSHPPIYMLAGGMALIIPTTVAVLSAASYKPPPDYQDDAATRGTEPPADVAAPPTGATVPAPIGAPAGTNPLQSPPSYTPPPAPGGTTGPSGARAIGRRGVRTAAREPLPTSVVNLYAGSLRVGVPAVEVRPMYSATELRQYGVTQHEEVRIPVFHAVF